MKSIKYISEYICSWRFHKLHGLCNSSISLIDSLSVIFIYYFTLFISRLYKLVSFCTKLFF